MVPADSPGSGRGRAFLGHCVQQGLGEPGGQVTKAVSVASLTTLGQQGSLFPGQPGLTHVDSTPLVFWQKGPLRWSSYTFY